MIQKESVKQRLERDDAGISYTEFTYMILQSYDFAELNRRYGCGLQLGGSDQWGNITGGIDLTRRLYGNQVFGLTMPLITKSDGTKFGKTESGTIWLDPARTSPYAFYQFWLGVADADVYKFLRYFTFLPVEQIAQIEVDDAAAEGKPQAQRILAEQATELVHGVAGRTAAERITSALFSGELEGLSAADFEQLQQDGLPSADIRGRDLAGQPLTSLLTELGLAKAGKEIKDALGRNAVLINGRALSMADNMAAPEVFAQSHALHGRYYLVKLGRKKYLLVTRGG